MVNKTTTKLNFARHWKTCNERMNIESHGTKNNETGSRETENRKFEPKDTNQPTQKSPSEDSNAAKPIYTKNPANPSNRPRRGGHTLYR